MLRLFRCTVLWSVLTLALLGVGCDSPPQSSDPEQGRTVLQKSLEAWKAGESTDALLQGTPAITFVDFQQKKNWKLLDFELDRESAPSGFDVQFIARLTLRSPEGKQVKQKAKYNVGTTSKFVVVRSDDA